MPRNLKFLKQVNVPFIGAITESLFNTLPLLSIFNFISVLIILYTSIRTYLPDWFRLWEFFLMAVVLIIVALTLVYIFINLSLWTFRNRQMFGRSNDISNILKDISERLKRLEEKK
jgi:nitrogen fixation-related uncharacterized protein